MVSRSLAPLLSVAAGAILLTASTVDAFFILSHPKSLVHTRLDPIVNPGTASMHAHNVVGASSFNRTYDHTLQRQAKCTTSPVQDNLSSYWAPQMYYQAENGTFTIVPTAFVQTYYLNRNGPRKDPIKAFPPGLRMLAGDPKRTTFDPTDFTNTAISFVCLDYDGHHEGDPAWEQRHNLFEHDCPNGQRAQINFPSCWNGKDLDSDDHKSHMAYPIQNVDGGDCPDTHPVQLVSLFYEFVYSTEQFPYRGPGTFVFSTGDITGYSFHADFTDGWDTQVLQSAIDTCPDDTSGNIDCCPALAASIDHAKQQGCMPENEIVDEDVGLGTWLRALPGTNELKDVGGRVVAATSKQAGEALVATETKFVAPGGALPGGWKSVGCFTEGVGAQALQGFSVVNEAMTPTLCLDACKAQGFEFAGIEFGKECYCDSSLGKAGSTNKADPAPVCGAACPGNAYAICGGASTLSVFSSDANYVAPVSTSPSSSAASTPAVVVHAVAPSATAAAAPASDADTADTENEDGSDFSASMPGPISSLGDSSSSSTTSSSSEEAHNDVQPPPAIEADSTPAVKDGSSLTPGVVVVSTPAAPPQPSASGGAKGRAKRLRAQQRRARMHHRVVGADYLRV